MDVAHRLVPSFRNLINTYRGNIENTCLVSKERLIHSEYEEAYTSGIITEKRFDQLNIPLDSNNAGELVSRDVGISLENRQCAKTLTNLKQIQERRDLLHRIKMDHHRKVLALFESEEKVYSKNTMFEMMIVNKVIENRRTPTALQDNTVHNDSNPQNAPYAELADKFTYDEILLTKSHISRGSIESFVQARSS